MSSIAFLLAVYAHILLGSVALLFYWSALLSTKGSRPHKTAGRWFFSLLMAVALSVGPVLLLRPGVFQPAYAVQFGYLALCLATVATIGWSAVRWRQAPERFRGLHFKLLGPVLFLLGVVVLVAGVAGRDPLPAVLSWVGLAYGGAMVRFAWLRAPLHPMWWLNWHLNATCGLFTAVHGTLLFVAWRWLLQPEASRETAAAFQLAVLAAALALRLWFGHRRQVPLRFTAAPAQAVRTAAAR